MEKSLLANIGWSNIWVADSNNMQFQINYVTHTLSMQLIEIGPWSGSYLVRIGHPVRLPEFRGFICHWSD